jgi:hypothetical protein
VVIAAYQVADCIAEAIASVLEQTAPPLEIIVSDDGSTDDLSAALSPFAERITVLHGEHGGEAAAKNAGIWAAQGEFVAILDADDAFLPERLAQLGEAARLRPDLDIITSDAFLEVDGTPLRRVYTREWTFVADGQREAILRRNFIFGQVAVRRALLIQAGGFDTSITRTTDWECWIRLVLDGARVGAVLEPLGRYRVRPDSLSASRALMDEGAILSLTHALAHPRLEPPERRIALATLSDRRRALARARLTEALRTPQGLRRKAVRIAVGRHAAAITRLKALAAATFPGPVVRVAQSRSGDGWTGAGGTRVGRA